jgi:hypothetical protein
MQKKSVALFLTMLRKKQLKLSTISRNNLPAK